MFLLFLLLHVPIKLREFTVKHYRNLIQDSKDIFIIGRRIEVQSFNVLQNVADGCRAAFANFPNRHPLLQLLRKLTIPR
jgi:hypothetical protein